ncbi:TetR/AcrR family transcriptional regulator [Streptomyces parvulus]|uniref:TetR/AcrR family transcriptional regulator n=1 Tax=Streptomyces parvulus TaxID=146923 RepID=A0A369UXP2_9ACTN|nr:TetR/AcrR family transcriptional regulator [Streptomyces parvulus]
MGRPRAFEETAVLDAAAAEFRLRGFAETSTEQLCEAAGVRRSSLYNAFVSKDELYVRALEQYVKRIRERLAGVLFDMELTGAERLTRLMDGVVEEERAAREQGHAAGCMVVHSRMNPELRRRDDRVTRILDRDMDEYVDIIGGVIRAGRVDGSIAADADPRAGSFLVMTLISGIRVSAQAGVGIETLRQVAMDGLRSLVV